MLGYGVLAGRIFNAGDFLLDYHGDLIDPVEADKIEDQSYIFHFNIGRSSYW